MALIKLQPKTRRIKPRDIQCLLLAHAGFAYKLIMAETGLSRASVHRKLKAKGIKLSQYRNAETRLAGRIVDLVETDTVRFYKALQADLQQLLK